MKRAERIAEAERIRSRVIRKELAIHCFSSETHPRLRLPVVIHVAQHAHAAVQIQRCIDSLSVPRQSRARPRANCVTE